MIFIILLLLVFSVPVTYRLDSDFGWHLFLGKKIFETKSIQNTLIGYNTLSSTHLEDHEWLSEIITYIIYNKFGYLVLTLIVLLISFLIILFIYELAIKRSNSKGAAILATSLFFMPYSAVFNGIRYQYIMLLGGIVILYVYDRFKLFETRLFFYLLIFSLGINLHGGFLILAILPAILELKDFKLRNFLESFLSGIAAIFAILFTPNPISYSKLILDYLSDSYYKHHIEEWFSLFTPRIIIMFILHLTFLILLLTIYGYWKKIRKNELLLIILLLILSLIHLRFYMLFALAVTPYLAEAFSGLQIKYRSHYPIIDAIPYIVSIILIIAFCGQIDFSAIKTGPWQNNVYPVKASLFLEKNHPKIGNLFNEYDWGGYLLWNYPNMKVFIDGRGPQLKINNKTTLLEEYDNFFSQNQSVTKEKLNQYKITSVIISNKQTKNFGSLDKLVFWLERKNYKDEKPQGLNLISYLSSSKDWQKVYEDDTAIIFFRKQ